MKKLTLFFITMVCLISSIGIIDIKANNDSEEYELTRFDITDNAVMYIDNNNTLIAFETKDTYSYRPYNTSPTVLDTNVMSVEFRGYQILYIKTDYSLWGFIYEANGNDLTNKPIKIMDNVLKIAEGSDGSFNGTDVIKTNGELWRVSNLYVDQFKISKRMDNVKEVITIFDSNYVLKSNGMLLKEDEKTKKTDVIMNNIKKIDRGFAIDNNDALWSWGDATRAIVGQGICYPEIDSTVDRLRYKYPKKIAENVKSVKRSGDQAYYISNNNELYAWGYFGQRLDYYNDTDIENKVMAEGVFRFFKDYNIKSPEFIYGYTGWPYTYTHVLSPLKISNNNVKAISNTGGNSTYLHLDENNDLYLYGSRYGDSKFLANITVSTVENIKNNTFDIDEKEIYTKYPESLTNETDDMYDLAMQHTIQMLGDRTLADDFLTSYKYLLNVDHLSETIIKHFLGEISGQNIIYNDYLDKVALDLCSSASEVYSIYDELSIKTKELNDDWSMFKKAINTAKTIEEKILIIKNFKGLNINKSDKEIKAFLDYYDKSFEKYDTFVKKIDQSLEVWDLIRLNLNISSLDEEIVQRLIAIFPENSVLKKRLVLIKNRISNPYLNVTSSGLKFSLDKTVKFFQPLLEQGFQEELFSIMTGGKAVEVSSLEMKIAKLALSYISDQIDVPSLDGVMNTTIYSSVNGVLYAELYNMRNDFITKSNDENITEKINTYKCLYKTMNKSFIDMLENASNMGSTIDKNTTNNLLKYIKTLDYNMYLKKCNKKINRSSIFNYRIDNGKAYIVGINDNKTTTLYRSKTIEQEYLIIPDEIDGYEVAGIDDNTDLGITECVILGKNIESISNIDASRLKILYINNLVNDFNNSHNYQSLEKVFTSSQNIIDSLNPSIEGCKTFGAISSIEVLQKPFNLNYSVKKVYDSKGLKLKLTNDKGETTEIDNGWIETIFIRNNKPILNIQIANLSQEVELTCLEDNISYQIHYEDEYGNQLSSSQIKEGQCLSIVDLQSKEIAGYEAINPTIKTVLDKQDKVITFKYHKTRKLDKSIYMLNVNEKEKVLDENVKNVLRLEENIVCDLVNNTIIAKKPGYTTLYYKDENGLEDNSLIMIKSPIQKIVLEKENITLKVDETEKINLKIFPIDTTDDKTIHYVSMNNNVASVDNEGYIKANEVGTTDILVKSSNGLEEKAKVVVEKGKPSYAEIGVYKGEQNKPLSTIKLPQQYQWKNNEEMIKQGENQYIVIYTPKDTINYISVEFFVTVVGKKPSTDLDVDFKENNGFEIIDNKVQSVTQTSDYSTLSFNLILLLFSGIFLIKNIRKRNTKVL